MKPLDVESAVREVEQRAAGLREVLAEELQRAAVEAVIQLREQAATIGDLPDAAAIFERSLGVAIARYDDITDLRLRVDVDTSRSGYRSDQLPHSGSLIPRDAKGGRTSHSVRLVVLVLPVQP